MELATNEQKLNYLKSREFELGMRVSRHGILKAESMCDLDWRPELIPYVKEWFRRRLNLIVRGNELRHEIEKFNEMVKEKFADLVPNPNVTVSYPIPSHANEMIKEDWKPNV